MEKHGKHIIKLKIDEEKDLYDPFDPGKNLSNEVIGYIMKKAGNKNLLDTIHLQIISNQPVNENDVRTAISEGIKSTAKELQRKKKSTVFSQIRLLIIGVALIALSLFLSSRISTLFNTVLTTIGSFSIWESANNTIIKLPKLMLQNKVLKRLASESEISFLSD